MDGYQTVVAALYEDEHDPLVGTVFQRRYRIESVIARGGMSVVYRATQLTMGRSVALKILPTDLARNLDIVARFQQEARAAASVTHANTVRVYDFGQTEGGILFLVMEHLAGESLADVICREGALSPERVVRIAHQILDALVEIHGAGIVHRDLKPENAFLADVPGRTECVKLLDFGIARLVDIESQTLTAPGTTVGSPPYISPEQARGEAVTGQSDLYSLGVILYEMLTGRRPFECRTASEYLLAHINQKPGRPRRDGRRMTGPLVSFVMRCLAKDANRRPQGAAQARTILERCESAPVHVEGDAWAEPLPLEEGPLGLHSPIADDEPPIRIGTVEVVAVAPEPPPLSSPEPLPAPTPAGMLTPVAEAVATQPVASHPPPRERRPVEPESRLSAPSLMAVDDEGPTLEQDDAFGTAYALAQVRKAGRRGWWAAAGVVGVLGLTWWLIPNDRPIPAPAAHAAQTVVEAPKAEAPRSDEVRSLMHTAERAASRGAWDEAVAAYEEAAERDDSPELQSRLGRTRRDRVVADNLRQAQAAHDAGRYAEAWEVLAGLPEPHTASNLRADVLGLKLQVKPRLVEALVDEMKQERRSRRKASSESLARRILEIDPDNDAAERALRGRRVGRVTTRSAGEPSGAAGASPGGPGQDAQSLYQAALAMELSDPGQALSLHQRAAEAGYHRSMRQIGYIHDTRGNSGSAREAYEAYLRRLPAAPDARVVRERVAKLRRAKPRAEARLATPSSEVHFEPF